MLYNWEEYVNMKVQHYTNSSGRDLIEEKINKLQIDEQVDARRVLLNLEEGKLDCLRIKQWQKKIYEVYFYKHNRMFYITVEHGTICILHISKKQKNKTEKKDKNIVIKRAKELGKIYKKKFV